MSRATEPSQGSSSMDLPGVFIILVAQSRSRLSMPREFRRITSSYAIIKRKKERREGEKREEGEKGNKEERERERERDRERGKLGAKRQNIVFPFFSQANDGETRCERCFQKKYTRPYPPAAPARGVSMCIFSPSLPPSLPSSLSPSPLLDAVALVSLLGWRMPELANFETKTAAESKTKLVMCLLHGRCKTRQV